jgi:hypothetical protein
MRWRGFRAGDGTQIRVASNSSLGYLRANKQYNFQEPQMCLGYEDEIALDGYAISQ